MTAIVHECEGKTFSEVLEKAKLVEQLNIDIEEINPAVKTFSQNIIENQNTKSAPRNDFRNKKSNVSPNYVCGRCSSKGKHYAQNCFALALSCNNCNMKGHIEKACRNEKSKSTYSKNNVQFIDEEDDPAKYFVMNYVGKDDATCVSHKESGACCQTTNETAVFDSSEGCVNAISSTANQRRAFLPPASESSDTLRSCNRFSVLLDEQANISGDTDDNNFSTNNINMLETGKKSINKQRQRSINKTNDRYFLD